ncbi:FkbM family methyltransferase [Bradyrhizobium sp. Tv2a-2]|uniref:FkbM family methyltransferase n=1 Tax=Bradyrhizobium sp. Tv2a-2 TaxID=113395 RepID=UPI000465347A|nr:FkbM family methyltransferase [Bradyrhizobium sp. Tv2a-2]
MNPEHLLPQFLLRAWPFPRGGGRLVDTFFKDLKFDAKEALVKTTDDFMMTVMPNEFVGRHIYLTGEFDRTVFEVLLDFSEPSDVLLDIGANVGYVSACFLKKVPSSRAVAVEPQPVVCEYLRRNLAQFGDRHAIFCAALSDRAGELPFFIDVENNGRSRLATGGEIATTTVQVLQANEFLSTEAIRVDIVKIDAEGHEGKIIRAAEDQLRRLKPRAILYEDHGGLQTRDGADLSTILEDLRYSVFAIEKRLTEVRLVQPFSGANDFIAVSRDRAIPERAKLKYGICLAESKSSFAS